jgi:uncharacterized membrane protein (DUF2068 family)
VVTASFVPSEFFELVRHYRLRLFGVLVANVVILWFLIRNVLLITASTKWSLGGSNP